MSNDKGAHPVAGPDATARPAARALHAQGATSQAWRVEHLAEAERARRQVEARLGVSSPPPAHALDADRAAAAARAAERPQPNPLLATWPRHFTVPDRQRWRGAAKDAPRVAAMEGAGGGLLRLGHWPATATPPAFTVVLLPGRNEPLEKIQPVVPEWQARGAEVFALDWQGQAMASRYTPDSERGDIPGYGHHLADLATFLDQVVRPQAAGRPLVMAAHSMGGHLALRHLVEQGDPVGDIRGAIVSAPLLDLQTPAWLPRWGVRLLTGINHVLGRDLAYAPMTGPWAEKAFDGNDLNSDADGFARMIALFRSNPDLRLGGVSNRWLRETYRSIEATEQPGYWQALATPVVLLSADDDRVVDPEAHRRVATASERIRLVRLGAPARHDIPLEALPVQARYWAEADRLLVAVGLAPPAASAAAPVASGEAPAGSTSAAPGGAATPAGGARVARAVPTAPPAAQPRRGQG